MQIISTVVTKYKLFLEINGELLKIFKLDKFVGIDKFKFFAIIYYNIFAIISFFIIIM